MHKPLLAILAVLTLVVSCSSPKEEPAKTANAPQISNDLSLGLGSSPIFRVGPGKDSTGTQVYSFTYVTAAAVFDGNGKIVDVEIDQLEVSTPNYDGASMPHFSGWPGSPEPNLTNHETEKVDGTASTTAEAIAEEVNGWVTKRERGDDYGMNANNDWWKQMDAWEAAFIGKTVDEVDEFYKNYTSARGRVLNPESKDAEELKKYNSLSKKEKEVLADVRSGATMAINDAHGFSLVALRDAWEKRKPMK